MKRLLVFFLCAWIAFWPALLGSCTMFAESERQTIEEALDAKAREAADRYERGESTQEEMQAELVRIAMAKAALQADRDTEAVGTSVLGMLGFNAAQAAAVLAMIRAWRGPATQKVGLPEEKVRKAAGKPQAGA